MIQRTFNIVLTVALPFHRPHFLTAASQGGLTSPQPAGASYSLYHVYSLEAKFQLSVSSCILCSLQLLSLY